VSSNKIVEVLREPESPQPERLYDAVRQVACTWKRDGRNGFLQPLGSVLKQEGREKVMHA
jgi:hypothetical protein